MKIALGIEYDGSSFHGWQSQENLPTIQAHLEQALSRIADTAITVFCAGRTDAGVHATGQVVHFNTTVQRPLHAFILGTNAYLPRTISVQWALEVDEAFHARFSALHRRYRYIIHNSSMRSALHAKRVTECHTPLAIEPMQLAAQYLVGEHDFTSFRAAQCESRSPMRNVHEITIKRSGSYVIIEIQANAFLHHMVRNIAGVLIQIGVGHMSPQSMLEILCAKDRKAAAQTAPPDGLYFIQVGYPELYAFPKNTHYLL